MPRDEILEIWRDSGAWWEGEAPREHVEYLDTRGVRVVRTVDLPRFTRGNNLVVSEDDPREDISLRTRKLRDEKVSRAMGYAPPMPQVQKRLARESAYVPYRNVTGYSFGCSTLFPEEVARLCASFGCPASGIADLFSLAGVVEFAHEARRLGVKPLIGATLLWEDGSEIVLFALSNKGYRNLSAILTRCHLEENRLMPCLRWAYLDGHCDGLMCFTSGYRGKLCRLLSHKHYDIARVYLERLTSLFGRDHVVLEVELSFLPRQLFVAKAVSELAQTYQVTVIPSKRVLYRTRNDYPVQDVVCCARGLIDIEDLAGKKSDEGVYSPSRGLNCEEFLHSPLEFMELYESTGLSVHETVELSKRFDDWVLPERSTLPCRYDDADQVLTEACYAGTRQHYHVLPYELRRRVEMELERIIRLGFSAHFVLMWDLCNWARSWGSLFSGRGSVVDSCVAFFLGLTRINAFEHDLHFDRFLPDDGGKRPDIDIDFEAKDRNRIRDYLCQVYGEKHVAGVGAISTYRVRGALRDLGKVFGLPESVIKLISKNLHGSIRPEALWEQIEKRPELRDGQVNRERWEWVCHLAGQLADIPNGLRAHSSGVVVTSHPVSDYVPLQVGGFWSDNGKERWIQIMQWDKRSAKHFFDKFDLLCLRGQDVLSGTQKRLQTLDASFDSQHLPLNDPETYRAMRSGELIGIPQSASPAMRQAHVRLRTSNLADASLVQAGIRPGVGGAVKMNQLIRRRRGEEVYNFEHPDFEKILGHTYGIIVFQEQVDQLLQTFGGYSGDRAEEIREAIHKRRREDYALCIRDELIRAILERGYSQKAAEMVYEYVSGFKGYGFAQGHALAFAEISVRSIYCQQNYPAAYFAALLDAQPAGYYGPTTLANEARNRGVDLLPPSVNRSDLHFLVEDIDDKSTGLRIPGGALRVSLNQISGLSSKLKNQVIEERAIGGPFKSLWDFYDRCRPAEDEMLQLVLAGAFDEIAPNRRRSVLEVPGFLRYLSKKGEGLLEMEIIPPPSRTNLEDFSEIEKALIEREVLGLDVRQHLMSFERQRVLSKGGVPAREVQSLKHGERVMAVGNPIRLRFPPTPTGRRVVFFDLEDESGLLNVTAFDEAYQRDGSAIIRSPYLTVIGEVQERDGHKGFLLHRAFPYRPAVLEEAAPLGTLPIATADFLVG